MALLNTVYLSLGSNLGDRPANLERAAAELRLRDAEVVRLSSIYETEPVGLKAQPWFLNQVAEVRTGLFPLQLLDRLQAIERRMGRRRQMEQGPRPIDIDILLYGNFRIRSERLVVPHPRFPERRFVLEPLAEIAPDLRYPVTRLTIREMLAACPDRNAVRRLPQSPNLQITKSPNR